MEGEFILRFEYSEYSYYIADAPLGEEAILGENNPPSTAATGLGVGISATGKEQLTLWNHPTMAKMINICLPNLFKMQGTKMQ